MQPLEPTGETVNHASSSQLNVREPTPESSTRSLTNQNRVVESRDVNPSDSSRRSSIAIERRPHAGSIGGPTRVLDNMALSTPPMSFLVSESGVPGWFYRSHLACL